MNPQATPPPARKLGQKLDLNFNPVEETPVDTYAIALDPNPSIGVWLAKMQKEKMSLWEKLETASLWETLSDNKITVRPPVARAVPVEVKGPFGTSVVADDLAYKIVYDP